jgi:hypothetical protein
MKKSGVEGERGEGTTRGEEIGGRGKKRGENMKEDGGRRT